jgi:hypothetical protein
MKKNFCFIGTAAATAVVWAGAWYGFWRPPRLTAGQAAKTPAGGSISCGSAAFLTFEQGKLAAVDWVDHTAGGVRTRVVETQSHTIDAIIDLRSDETAAHSSTAVFTVGEKGEPVKAARDLGEGAIYWSPRIPSSIEQAIARARVLNKQVAHLSGASLFSDAKPEITVERIDPDDWVVRYRDKKYLVLTDDHGCMISATMPDYGVVIERRSGWSAESYPPWQPYAAPPDGA